MKKKAMLEYKLTLPSRDESNSICCCLQTTGHKSFISAITAIKNSDANITAKQIK